jgi:hypothetical protein
MQVARWRAIDRAPRKVRRRHCKYLLNVRLLSVKNGRVEVTYFDWSSGREVGSKLIPASDLGLAEPQSRCRRAPALAV